MTMIRLNSQAHALHDSIKSRMARISPVFVGTAPQAALDVASAELAAMAGLCHQLRMAIRTAAAESRRVERESRRMTR